jgi:O-antigen/teichoic acid export membrane protein
MIFNRIKSVFANRIVIVKNFLNFNFIYYNTVIIQIMIIPLLIRAYGLDGYGKYVFIVSVVSYAETLVVFGFDYYLLRFAVENKKNFILLNRYYNASVYARLIIFLTIFIIINIITSIFSVPLWNNVVFVMIYISIIKTIFIPKWYFQSINKLNILSYASLSGNIILLVGSFILYQFQLPIEYYASCLLISSLIQIVIIQVKIKKLLYLYFRNFKYLLKDIQFLFNVSYINMISGLTQLYTNFTITLLGVLFTGEVVAIYEISTRIINFVKTPFVMLNNSIYPEIIRNKNINRTYKYFKIEIIMIIVFVGILYLFKPYIFLYFTGLSTPMYGYIMTLLSFTILAIVSNQVLGFHILYNYGYDSIRARGVIYSSLLYILAISIYFFIGYESVIYICIALVFAEFTTSVYYIFNILKLQLEIKEKCVAFTE